MGLRLLRRVPALATAMLAALTLAYGLLHPALNFDVVPYAALAKQLRGAGDQHEAYRELAAEVGEARFQAFTSSVYRERLYRDDGYFALNRQLYTIRPLYIAATAVVGAVIGSDIRATYVVSAVSTALAVLVSLLLADALGLAGPARLAVPLSWIGAGALNLASLSTPDGLEALLDLGFVWIAVLGPWSGARAAALAGIAALMIATRTDAVVLAVLLAAAQWLHDPPHRLQASCVLAAALAAYLAVELSSGNFGYVADFNFQLVEPSTHDVVPNLTISVSGYFRALARGLVQILGADFQSALYALAFGLLVLAGVRERRARRTGPPDPAGDRALVLIVGLAAYLVVRFVLFPAPWARYVTAVYVLAGILLARSLQSPPRRAGGATPEAHP